MKQHINIEQISELSEFQEKELIKWWNPKLEHIVYEKDYSQGVPLYVVVDNDLRSGWSLDQAMEDVKILPLLSIGQMIQFLKDKDIQGDSYIDNHFTNVISTNKTATVNIGWNGERQLVDELWKAVKEEL